MTTYARRLAVAASALAAVAALGACNDEPEPTFADPTPTDPTTSATDDEPTPPELPDTAEEKSSAGAQSFVAFYWETVSYSQQSGDTKPLQALEQDTCRPCAAGRRAIDHVYSRGGKILGSHYEVVSSTAKPLSASDVDLFEVDPVVKNDEQRVVGAGDLNQTFDAGSVTYSFVLVWDDGWIVSDWRQR